MAYDTVQDEGTARLQRTTLNFIGSSITATDNPGALRTDVTVSQSPTASTSLVGVGRAISTTAPLTGGGDLSADRTLGISITTTNDGGAIVKQPATPGTQQTSANLNISGTGVFGGDVKPQGNISGSPANVASKVDLGTRSMSSTPTAGQIDNRVGFSLIGAGRFGLDNDNRGSLAIISLTGATGWSNAFKIVHTNTQTGTDSTGLRIDTNVSSGGAGGAGAEIINDGYGDALYLASRGPTSGVTSTTVGLGVDLNRSAVSPFTGERNPDHKGFGVGCDNFSTTDPGAGYGSIAFSGRNMGTSYSFPVFSGVSNFSVFQTAPWTTPTVDTAGNPAIRLMDSSGIGTPKAVWTHGGWIGIGINPPTAPLHVSSGAYVLMALRHNVSGGSAQIHFQRSSDGTGRTSIGYDNTNDYGFLGNSTSEVIKWNQSGYVSFVGGQPGARSFQATAQNIPNANPTAVTFDTNGFNRASVWASATNTRFTVPAGASGTWLIRGQLAWPTTGSGIVQCFVKKNGSTIVARNIRPASSAVATIQEVTYIDFNAADSDYYEIFAYQDSGTSATLVVTDSSYTFGEVAKLY